MSPPFDHLRKRGGISIREIIAYLLGAPSPHARRYYAFFGNNRSVRTNHLRMRGGISYKRALAREREHISSPLYAEVFPADNPRHNPGMNHNLRARGGISLEDCLTQWYEVSSPRMRRCFSIRDFKTASVRIVSAHAEVLRTPVHSLA